MYSRFYVIRPLVVSALMFSLISTVTRGSACAQSPFRVSDHYTKFEYMIVVRDGVKLFTSVYVPKDAGRKYPILMDRTPYSVGPYGADKYKSNLGPTRKYDEEGYIFVFQDVRGRNRSEGVFVNARPYLPVKHGQKDVDESTDALPIDAKMSLRTAR